MSGKRPEPQDLATEGSPHHGQPVFSSTSLAASRNGLAGPGTGFGARLLEQFGFQFLLLFQGFACSVRKTRLRRSHSIIFMSQTNDISASSHLMGRDGNAMDQSGASINNPDQHPVTNMLCRFGTLLEVAELQAALCCRQAGQDQWS